MRRPLVALGLGFGAGIALQGVLGWSIVWPLAIALGLATLTLILWCLRLGGPLRFLLWGAILLMLGMARGALPDSDDGPVPTRQGIIRGVAQSAWRLGEGIRWVDVQATELRPLGGEPETLTGRVRLSVPAVLAIPEPGVAPEDGPLTCPRVLPGDSLRALVRLSPPRSYRNFGVPDLALRARRQGLSLRAYASSCAELVLDLGPAPDTVIRLAEGWRDGLHRFLLQRQGSPAGKGILAALTTGDEGAVPARSWEAFRMSGLAHLLSISGLHLAIVALGWFWLLRRGLPWIPGFALRVDVRRAAAGLTLPLVAVYVLLAGSNLPVIRAGIMAACFLLAQWLRRTPDPFQTLSAAWLIVLGLWPQALFEASFQLSFAGVAAILLGVPALSRLCRLPAPDAEPPRSLLRRLMLRGLQLLLVSLAATLGTLPITAWHFNQLSGVGLIANLVAVPFATLLIVPLGLVLALLWPISSAAAGVVADAGVALSDLLDAGARWFASWPLSDLHPATPSALELVLWATLLVVASRIGVWRRAGSVALVAGLGLLLSWGAGWLAPRLSGDLSLTFLDVGQGDATLVRVPGGASLLIDGGAGREGGFDAGRRVVAPALWSQGISRLDAVALTHAHPDHAGGLPSVIRAFRPREVWVREGIAQQEPEAFAPVAAATAEVGAVLRPLRPGDQPWSGNGFAVEVLAPEPGATVEENDRSLVLKVTRGRRTTLLVGDLEDAGEQALLRADRELHADVLKVAHHGSAYSTGDEFLSRVRPALAVISVGAGNPYGLPDPETEDRLQKAGATLVRTDRDGAVQVTTDGEDLERETAAGVSPVEP